MALGRFRYRGFGGTRQRRGGLTQETEMENTTTRYTHRARRTTELGHGGGGWGLVACGWWCRLADGPSVLSNWRLMSQSHLPPATCQFTTGCSAQACWEQARLKWTRVFVRLRAVKGVMQTRSLSLGESNREGCVLSIQRRWFCLGVWCASALRLNRHAEAEWRDAWKAEHSSFIRILAQHMHSPRRGRTTNCYSV
jgi:hypothetical protein